MDVRTGRRVALAVQKGLALHLEMVHRQAPEPGASRSADGAARVIGERITERRDSKISGPRRLIQDSDAAGGGIADRRVAADGSEVDVEAQAPFEVKRHAVVRPRSVSCTVTDAQNGSIGLRKLRDGHPPECLSPCEGLALASQPILRYLQKYSTVVESLGQIG